MNMDYNSTEIVKMRKNKKPTKDDFCKRCRNKESEIICLNCIVNMNWFCIDCDIELHSKLESDHIRVKKSKFSNKSNFNIEEESVYINTDSNDLNLCLNNSSTLKNKENYNYYKLGGSLKKKYYFNEEKLSNYNLLNKTLLSTQSTHDESIDKEYSFQKYKNLINNIETCFKSIEKYSLEKLVFLENQINAYYKGINLIDSSQILNNNFSYIIQSFYNSINQHLIHTNEILEIGKSKNIKLKNLSNTFESNSFNFQNKLNLNEKPKKCNNFINNKNCENNDQVNSLTNEKFNFEEKSNNKKFSDLVYSLINEKETLINEFKNYKLSVEKSVIDTIDEIKNEYEKLSSENKCNLNYIGELENEILILNQEIKKFKNDFDFSESLLHLTRRENVEKHNENQLMRQSMKTFDRICFGKITSEGVDNFLKNKNNNNSKSKNNSLGKNKINKANKRERIRIVSN